MGIQKLWETVADYVRFRNKCQKTTFGLRRLIYRVTTTLFTGTAGVLARHRAHIDSPDSRKTCEPAARAGGTPAVPVKQF